MSDFEPAVQFILDNSQGLIENPNDPGGIANCGISLRFLKSIIPLKLRSYGVYDATDEYVRTLTPKQAQEIYYGEYWVHASFYKLENQDVCNYIFDMAVCPYMGLASAVKCAQRAIWSIKHKKDAIIDDGILSDNTIIAINDCDIFILPAMHSERGNYYRLLVERNPDLREFLEGFLKRSYGG